MSRFFSNSLAHLTPYTPGEQPKEKTYIKLNTNESPFPPSKKAIEEASKAAQALNLYPDPTCSALTEAVATAFGVKKDQIILGNGSDEILFFAFSAFCDCNTPAIFPNITYGFYKVFASLCKVNYTEKPLNPDFSVNLSDYTGVNKTVFIANPNAPTGIALPLCDIEKIIKSNPDNIVVVDEAYVDFGGESAVKLIDKYENLLVVQTFSKSRSMAGGRLGMGFANKSLIADLNTVKYSLNPYNINKMTMAAGIGVLADGDYTKACIEEVVKNREYTKQELIKRGFWVTDSKTNFLFAKHPNVAGEQIYSSLKSKNILVRHFTLSEITDYNRITIGTKQQMDKLLEAIDEILKGEL